MEQRTALVLGGNGFIGHHLARRLKKEGYWVRVVDIEAYKYGPVDYADEHVMGDLTDIGVMRRVVVDKYQEPFYESRPFDEIYQLAALMGGAGFIFTGDNDADIMTNSALINLNLCRCLHGTEKVFYSSSACMYPQELQLTGEPGTNVALKESDAYPANPDSEYGWEKLFSERLFLTYHRNKGVDVRIGRFHNIFGPEGVYTGGKEKAPAAVCRKVAELTQQKNTVEVWGDGKQLRSFLYIDECINAVRRLMISDTIEPVNIGSSEMISINDLVQMVLIISNKTYARVVHIPGPQGVRARNSDNTFIQHALGWAPSEPLYNGMEKLYNWVNKQVNK
jgi:GDP-D-mannose 3',5'-epimerase